MGGVIDDFWDDLLGFIEERRVVPIIGQDLLEVDLGHGPQPVAPLYAAGLAERLRIPVDPAAPPTLDQVARAHLQRGGRKEDIYSRLRAVGRELEMEVPECLRQLASIEAFDLFVSLSFEGLMVRALNEVRFGAEPRTLHLGFSPNRVDDLPAERAHLDRPVVYSLFGKLSAAPEYVVTEEDMLEFSSRLQSEVKRPQLLFDELRSSHLLVIGAALPDWMTRFFVRIAKDRQLSQYRSEQEFVVDSAAAGDDSLVSFFSHYSYGTKVLEFSPRAFVAELAERWANSGRATIRGPQTPTLASRGPARIEESAMAPGNVFLSYAKEDLSSALELKAGLEQAGISAWLDKNQLEAGDLYDQKIRRYIKTCGGFIPIISRNTERRAEGYFRREWKLAAERVQGIAENVPFVIPVVVDDTPEYGASVPEAFLASQWTRLPGGRPSSEFALRVGQVVQEFRLKSGPP